MALRVGLRKTSLVDYPGKVAATLFFPACNLRCPWCHNRGLIEPATFDGEESDLVDLEDAVALIEKRSALLGGVTLSGGEPTLRRELPALIARFKAGGMPVKLDTNGIDSGALERLFADAATKPDYVALDLKLAPERYIELVPPVSDPDERKRIADRLSAAVKKSAALLASSGIDHEFRSLVFGDGYFSDSDIGALAPIVDEAPWYFSAFRPGSCLDPRWNERSPGLMAEAERSAESARSYGKRGRIRSG